MFTPQIVDLTGPWPPCPTGRCGSTAAVARVDVPHGPIAVGCENGHFRTYLKIAEVRASGRFAGAFSRAAVAPLPPRDARRRRLEPNERRCAEVLEDADRCALCGTQPAVHPYQPDLDVRGDRDVLAWFQRWRPALYAELRAALAIVARGSRVSARAWRLELPAQLRERVVAELDGSALQADHVVPLAHVERVLGSLTPLELDFAVDRLLVAVCRRCNEGRWRVPRTRDEYVRDYVTALYGGDARLARADATRWRTMEALALHAARAGAGERTA